MKKQTLVAGASVLLLIVFAIATFLYNTQKTGELSASAQHSASSLVRDYSPTKGNKSAKVTIVEFFDPACGTCKAFHPFVEHLMEANPGKIKLVMRYTPLHTGSGEIVKILEAANLQNKYWEILEQTYATQSSWAINHTAYPDKLWKILAQTELDIVRAEKDVKSPLVAQRIQQDKNDAKELQVSKTPGFFVNGKPLIHFGYEQLQDMVEAEIRNNY